MEVVDEIFAPTLLFNGTAVSREAIKQLVTARRILQQLGQFPG